MKIRYILKDKKLQKKLNLQASITEKKLLFTQLITKFITRYEKG